jgi:hypothetical protein
VGYNKRGTDKEREREREREREQKTENNERCREYKNEKTIAKEKKSLEGWKEEGNLLSLQIV